MEYSIALGRDDHGVVVRDFIAQWIDQPALRQIVEAEGGEWPAGSLVERVTALHKFSERWDRRAGGERLEIDRSTDNTVDSAIVLATADALGLSRSAPPSRPRYDHGLALGGTALASALRVKHLYSLRRNGVSFGAIGMLTALREVSDEERAFLRDDPLRESLICCTTEFDVMVAAAEFFSETTARIEKKIETNPHASSARAYLDHAEVLAAPSSDSSRRANTFDNYAVYRDRLRAGDSLLIVTSAIYLPYQFLIAVQALGWNTPLQVEAIGFPPEWLGGVLTQPANYLQELRSALFAASTTLAKLDQASSA